MKLLKQIIYRGLVLIKRPTRAFGLNLLYHSSVEYFQMFAFSVGDVTKCHGNFRPALILYRRSYVASEGCTRLRDYYPLRSAFPQNSPTKMAKQRPKRF